MLSKKNIFKKYHLPKSYFYLKKKGKVRDGGRKLLQRRKERMKLVAIWCFSLSFFFLVFETVSLCSYGQLELLIL